MKKKTTCAILLLLLVFSLAGCGSSNAGNTDKPGKTERTEQNKNAKDDKSKADKASKNYDYPNVTAYYLDGNEIKNESFPLSPEHEFFSKENFSWELDLGGQTIELKDVFEMKTDVRIVNGRFKTSSEGYIVNNGTLRLGDVNDVYSNAYGERGIVHFSFGGKGIINNGEVIMENTNCTVESGVGIANSGKIAPSFEDSYNYSNYPQSVEVYGGTFLENDGEAYLGNFQIAVSESQGIINKETGKLFLFANSEVAVGTGTGIVNLGGIERCSSYGDMKIIISVEGGIGIDNSGSLGAMADLWVDGGTSIYNRATGVVGDENDYMVGENAFRCWMIVDKGTAFVNEGKFYGHITCELKDGTLLKNEGGYKGEIRAVVAKKEAYEGTLLENSANGVWEGGIQAKVSALKNATIFKNAGTYKGTSDEFFVCAGAYYGNWEHDDHEDWINRDFGFDQSVPIENSTIVRVENGAVWDNVAIRLAIAGTNTGNSKGVVFEEGSEYKGDAWFGVSMFTNDCVGLTFESGTIMSGSLFASGRIGLGGTDDFFVYRSMPDRFNEDELKNNCLIKNFATLPEFRFELESCSGNNNVGMENFGTVESFSNAVVNVQGSYNTGLINRGSFSGGYIYVTMRGKNNKGNNIGAVNHSIMDLMFVGSEDDREVYGDTVTTLIPEDATNCVGFKNEALAVLKATNGITAQATSSCFVSFENYGNLTTGSLQISSRAGKVFIQGAGGYISAEEIYVNTYGDGPALLVGDLIDVERTVYVESYVRKGISVEIETVGTITADNFNVYAPKGSTGIENSGNIRGRLCSLHSDVSGSPNCIRGGGGLSFTSDIYVDDEYVFY